MCPDQASGDYRFVAPVDRFKLVAMVCLRRFKIVLLFAGCVAAGSPCACGQDSQTAQLDFFERHIRPLFVEHCVECHGPEKQQGGLRLDHAAGWETGGDSGPAIIPGSSVESLLFKAIRYQSLEMPPDGQLPESTIGQVEEWINSGAVDPRLLAHEGPASAALPVERSHKHWAYRPIDPKYFEHGLDDASAVIDRLVANRLAEVEIPIAPAADRWTLLRRLHYDLIGLPPSIEDIRRFEADDDPGAYERLVNRLLESDDFGRRWGRHWLDVARYGESVTLRGFIYKQAWRYRDYVIDAFNHDLPFDQFVRQQIAGDLLPTNDWPERNRTLVATTFLMLGNINYEEQDKRQLEMDVIDEQLDAIGRAFMAQTIGCARCHDHKFDPIPAADYYALAGILKSSTALEHENVSKWIELPLSLPPDEAEKLARYRNEIDTLNSTLAELRKEIKELGGDTTPGPLDASELPGIVVDSSDAVQVGAWQNSQSVKNYIGDGYLHDGDTGKGEKTLTFQPAMLESGEYEVRLAFTASGNRCRNAPVTILHVNGESVVHVDQTQEPAIAGRFVSLGRFYFETGNQGYVLVSNQGTQGHVIADAVQFLRPDELATINSGDETNDAVSRVRVQIDEVTQQIQQLEAACPQQPTCMTVRDDGQYDNLPIHLRGTVHNLGDVVPRGFLQAVAMDPPIEIAADSNGRLELAQWITDPRNPLTSRVIVNRVWHWLFGAGLVRTTDNFGVAGEMPSHPEMLDELAGRFVADGWSIKRLVRAIVLSETYRRSAATNLAEQSLDPENRLLSRANRRPLDAESIRDSLLALSGNLVEFEGGRSYPDSLDSDYQFTTDAKFRSVYLPVFRNALPATLAVFDFPDPSTVTGVRDQSIVPGQALFLLNDEFVQADVAGIARTHCSDSNAEFESTVNRLHLAMTGRYPTAEELKLARRFLSSANPQTPDEVHAFWCQWIHALVASPAFRFLD